MSSPPISGRTASALRTFNASVAREKAHLLSEMLAVKGLIPLLMKPRNGERWSPDDKRLLSQHLKRLSRLSPYLVVLLMPGGLVALPALAWWLDRRRNRGAARRCA